MNKVPWGTMEVGQQYKYNNMIHVKYADGTQWSIYPPAHDSKFASLPDGMIATIAAIDTADMTSAQLLIYDFGVFNEFLTKPDNTHQ